MIIGAKGNIGKYYATLLKRLGQEVEGVDLGFDPIAYRDWHDSAIICTPPETHRRIIRLLPAWMPIFCEKPLITDPTDSFSWRVENDRTLVSANWIFCDHIAHLAKEKEFSLYISYPAKDKYWPWDLIHFWSWFVHAVGDPQKGTLWRKDDMAVLNLQSGIRVGTRVRLIMNVILTNGKRKCSIIDPKGPWMNGKWKKIHVRNHSCDMHIKQLRHWINVLKGKEKSINPIDVSLRHHRELGKLLGKL